MPEERDVGTRYRLLETVRQYAAELLESRGETAAVRRRHAGHFLAVAEGAQTRGAGQVLGMGRLDADIDNLRAALDLAIAEGDADTELRLVAALWPYWHVRGQLAEGTARLEAAIGRDGATASGAYLRAVYGAGILAWTVGDYARVRVLAAELLAAAAANDSRRDEHAGNKLLATSPSGSASSRRRSGTRSGRSRSPGSCDSDHEVGIAQLNLAVVYLDWGKTEAAIPMLEEVLAYNRRNGIVEGAGFALLNLGEADYHLGEYARARGRFEEARTAFASVGFKAHVGHALTGLAGVEASSGRYEDAARLLGRADAVMAAVGASKDDFDPTLAATVEAEARAHLGADGFDVAYQEGRRTENAG